MRLLEAPGPAKCLMHSRSSAEVCLLGVLYFRQSLIFQTDQWATSWSLGDKWMVIFDPALANMQLCPSPSSHCMRTQVTNYLICTVGDCLHLLLSLWFLRSAQVASPLRTLGRKKRCRPLCPQRRIEMIVPEKWEAFCSTAWLPTDAIWGQAKTELKRKPSRI